MKTQWLTTAPNPRGVRAAHRGYNADDGQRGWRTHAVEADDKETGADVVTRRSACGLRPAHGWGVDLFIEEQCQRCVKILAKKEATK